MVSDAEAAVREIGDDDSESTGGDIEIGEDGDDLVVGHPVEGFAEVDSGSNDSFLIFRGIINVAKDEVDHSYDVVNNRTAREATKLIKADVRGQVFPYPFDQQSLHPFAQEWSQSDASKIIFSNRNRDLVDRDPIFFFVISGPLMSFKAFVNDCCYGFAEFW